MTETPEDFADRPANSEPPNADAGPTQTPDLLSALLRTVRLRGEQIFFCAEEEPFAISFDHAGGTIHILNQGSLDLEVDGHLVGHHYEQGDVVLLPAGAAHVLRSGEPSPPRRVTEARANESVLPGPGVRWFSGTFSFEDSRGGRLLHALPSVIDLPGAQNQSLEWLDVSTRMLMKEKLSPSEGSAEMISRILDLLFIQVLRAWSARPDATAGWLTGAMDPVIGEAITAIHSSPGRQWSVKQLAERCNLSRSAFSDRFARTVGETPVAYLAQVRLDNAADLLHNTTVAVAAIASEVGYDSEAAFSRAFSKRFGMPPSRWRHQPSRS
jgi:AraC-like DNA-binding protein